MRSSSITSSLALRLLALDDLEADAAGRRGVGPVAADRRRAEAADHLVVVADDVDAERVDVAVDPGDPVDLLELVDAGWPGTRLGGRRAVLRSASPTGRTTTSPTVRGEQRGEAAVERVGEDQRPGHERDAEHDRERAQQQPDLAAEQALEGGPDHAGAAGSAIRAITSRTSSRVGLRSSSTIRPSARKTHPVGVRRGDRVVGDDHDGLPVVVDAAAQQLEHLGAGPGVEVAGRLVGEDDPRPADQRAGDRHPLLLAAGELLGLVVEPVPEADGRDHRVVPVLVRLAAGDRQREQDVLVARSASGTRLNDWNTKPISSRRSRVSALSLSRVRSWSPIRTEPGVGGVEGGAAVHQRRLAGAARPHHRGEAPGLEVDAHVVERDHLRLAGAVGLGQVAHARRRRSAVGASVMVHSAVPRAAPSGITLSRR